MKKSINFVVLGDKYEDIIRELGGKKGTATDIAIYDKKTPEAIYTWTVPITFPDKIQPLLQAVNIAQYTILNVVKIDRYLGEQILALDALDFRAGFLLHSYEVDEAKLKILIRDTSVSHFKLIDTIDQLKYEISMIKSTESENSEKKENIDSSGMGRPMTAVVIVIDHAFDVKGVGTVVLGVIKKGMVKVHDLLRILPYGKDILIKSIQMHDDPVEQATSPARVGLAIKGIAADDISRGDILSSYNDIRVNQDNLVESLTTINNNTIIAANFHRNPYYKGDFAENQSYLISLGLQIKPVKIRNLYNNTIEIVSEKSLVFANKQRWILLKPDSQGTRIVGQGMIV